MQVDDKYQYGCESKDSRVHGWISNDPPIGIWQITASEEYRSGGPLKQVLTSHVGPTSLTVSALSLLPLLFFIFYFLFSLNHIFILLTFIFILFSYFNIYIY